MTFQYYKECYITDVIPDSQGWNFKYRFEISKPWSTFSNPTENIVRSQHAAMVKKLLKEFENKKTR